MIRLMKLSRILWLAPCFYSLVVHADMTSVIQEAQKAAVAKNRKVATNKLLNAIKSEHTPKNKAKLMETLKSLADVFFTDQGQRLFETAQSMAYESSDTALARFNEALAMEDSNVVILLAMARVQLSKKDCASAETTLQTAGEINPYDKTLRFLRAKSLLCQHKATDALALLKMDPVDEPVANVTMASALYETGNEHEAMGLLQKTASRDASYPESHYWLWKVAEDKTDAAEDQGQKYIALCKNLNLRTRRKYINEPCLCGQTQEVEDAIKAAQKNADR